MTTHAAARSRDPLGAEAQRERVSLYSNETLRELAARRDTPGAMARRELDRRDREVVLAE